MDDAMLDLMGEHGELRRRLGAYAEARLSPDLAASTRMRARVLVVAHRQSALRRADATLALIADPSETPTAATRPAIRIRRPGPAWRRTAAVLLAAGLAIATLTGGALAARPAGALYGARVWVETLTLPVDPRERAIAELARLQQRLTEVTEANARGDAAAAGAALLAYQAIADEAAGAALASQDDIAILAIGAGMTSNIAVLSNLVLTLPGTASGAVQQALERAIARSQDTIRGIDERPAGGKPDGNGGNGGGPAAQPTADAPNATPTAKATKPPTPDPTPRAEPTAKPKPTAKPTGGPGPTAKPEPTPKSGPPGDHPGSPGAGATPRPTPRGGGD